MKKETKIIFVFAMAYLSICFVLGLDRSLENWMVALGFISWSGIMAFVYFGIKLGYIKLGD